MARIAFCQDVMVEFMGFMHMSAALKRAGHEVEVFIDSGFGEERFVRDVRAYAPDVAGFSVLTPSLPWALRAARRLKRDTRATTVFGNAHAIICPEIIEEPGVDVVCRWEGEGPLSALAARIDEGKPAEGIEGLWIKTARGVEKNPMPSSLPILDDLPPHDRALYDKYSFFKHSPYLRFLLGRGCPFRCSYCTNAWLLDHYGKGYVRKRSPESAVTELESLAAQRRPKFIYFVDEVFWVSNNWLREFLTLYKSRVGIPFSANYRYGPIEESDIELMAAAGCRLVILAVESGDEKQRAALLDKRVTDTQIIETARLLRKYGIRINTNVLFGLPGDTADAHIERLPLFRQINPAYLWTAFFQPYPGLKLSAEPETLAAMPREPEFGQTFHHDLFLDLPDRTRLVNLKKVYYLMMRFPAATPLLKRIIRFRIPFLFELLFMAHFTYYIFVFEHVSFSQYLHHIKVFALKPLLGRKKKKS